MRINMNKKIKFGIISGAGPMAGALLYQRVIESLQAKGAWQDADFPEIILLNIPFSEMLFGKTENKKVRAELLTALSYLAQTVDYIYIACQTLHIFLSQEEMKQYKIVSLLSLISLALTKKDNISVVASMTSRLFNLHTKHLHIPCHYLEPERSERAIEDILKGKSPNLEWLEKLAVENEIILGCTEFSVALQKTTGKFIDPITLAATDIIDKFIHHDR